VSSRNGFLRLHLVSAACTVRHVYNSESYCFMKLNLSLRFNGHFPCEPGLAGVYWSKGWWRWWRHWTTGYISRAKLQSNHHHQQANIQFLPARCPSCRPTYSVKALKGKYHIPWTCLPQAHLRGLPTLSLTTNSNSSWLPWGRVAMPLISPLMPVLDFMKLNDIMNFFK